MTAQDPFIAEEASWTVDGIRLAGVVSGPEDGIRVLAMHGWLDNAESFSVLRKFLPQVRLVALDMPGHGLSGHRSADSGYQIWDDLPQIVGVLDALGWEDCVILGHSRGALIGGLLAAAAPERISGLVTLDGVAPHPFDERETATQLRTFLKDRNRLRERKPRIFKSPEEYAERRSRSGEPPAIALALAERALERTEEGYAWRGDPRLSGASAIKLSQAQINGILSSIKVPVLNVWATASERLRQFAEAGRQAAQSNISDLTSVEIPGHHHWHMEEACAPEIASAIRAFLIERIATRT